MRTTTELFWAKVEKTDGCWLWTAGQRDGYGRFHVRRRPVSAHRFSYELLVGPIPEGLTLDHLCRNRACVNPGHLEPVTQRENLMRGEGVSARNAARTHCPQGHPYNEENTKFDRRKYGVSRRCRVCERVRWGAVEGEGESRQPATDVSSRPPAADVSGGAMAPSRPEPDAIPFNPKTAERLLPPDRRASVRRGE